MELLEKWACKFLIWRIKRGYGADCPDFAAKCISCEAKQAIEFLQEHVELIESF